MKNRNIRVSEIFGPTIQGEGVLIGKPTIFVRTGGCDYRCSWCDSMHAVDNSYRYQWKAIDSKAILEQVNKLSKNTPLLISLSGGNPAIQPFDELITQGKEQGYSFAMETQGSISQPWFKKLDYLILSPKPPSSKMSFSAEELNNCIEAAGDSPKVVLKFVVFDEIDYNFAREIAKNYPNLPVYLQPVNHTPPPADEQDAPMDSEGVMERMRWLIDYAMDDKWYEAHILPQLHTLIWGNKRGV